MVSAFSYRLIHHGGVFLHFFSIQVLMKQNEVRNVSDYC